VNPHVEPSLYVFSLLARDLMRNSLSNLFRASPRYLPSDVVSDLVSDLASHLNPPNRLSHVCNVSQLIRDIRYAGLTRLLGVKVEIHQLSTLPTSSLRTSSAPSGSFDKVRSWRA
jgi:hypothetical protein